MEHLLFTRQWIFENISTVSENFDKLIGDFRISIILIIVLSIAQFISKMKSLS